MDTISQQQLLHRDFAEQHMHTILARLAGPGAVPRADQVDAVHAVLQPASRVLVVQATGWGKSAVYWAATHAIRSTGAGPTLVVSPLLALMRDQVSAAERAGLKAATVNSTNIDDWDDVFQRLDADAIDVLLVSPERLGNPRFAARLGALLARVGLIVIDEAHTQLSVWTEYIKECSASVVGLSATPFSPGLGKLFTNLVNATTMHELTESGVLVPMRVYSCTQANMEGAATSGGESAAPPLTLGCAFMSTSRTTGSAPPPMRAGSDSRR